MRLRWLGQSGYWLQSGAATLLIDPYLSDIVYEKEGMMRLFPPPFTPEEVTADAVICTHDHMDHLDPVAAERMPKGTRFITTHGGRAHLHRLGQSNVTALSVGESVSVGDFTVTSVFARHSCEAFGLLVVCKGRRLYFSGDTLFDEALFDLSKCKPDFTFICINGKLGNMNVEEALRVAGAIGAPVNVPNHYGMFAENTEDPHSFADRIAGGRILERDIIYEI